MLIYLGADHRGFAIKEHLKQFLKSQGYEMVDLGNSVLDENDDYPDFASAVGRKVSAAPMESRGIVVCGSGAGVAIVADKFPGVRAVLAASGDQAYDARRDDDVNVLALAANFTGLEDAAKIVQAFLSTPTGTEDRYRRRLQKIVAIEGELYK